MQFFSQRKRTAIRKRALWNTAVFLHHHTTFHCITNCISSCTTFGSRKTQLAEQEENTCTLLFSQNELGENCFMLQFFETLLLCFRPAELFAAQKVTCKFVKEVHNSAADPTSGPGNSFHCEDLHSWHNSNENIRWLYDFKVCWLPTQNHLKELAVQTYLKMSLPNSQIISAKQFLLQCYGQNKTFELFRKVK